MSLLVLVLTFHHQLSHVDLVAPSQVPDVTLYQAVLARKNNHCLDLVCFVGPKLCGKGLTRSWKLMASVSPILHNLFSDSEMERKCCAEHRRREVHLCDPDFHTNAFSGRLSFSNSCVFQISNTSTSQLLPNATKVGLDEFL